MIRKNFLIFLLIISPIVLAISFNINNEAEKGLRFLANENNILFGTSVAYNPLLMDRKYKDTVVNEFNTITIENSMKFSYIHPEIETYDFKKSDEIVQFALNNNLKIRGHTLVWHKQLPNWITKEKYSEDELKRILRGHIQTIVSHYKGKFYALDVVNEAFNEDGSLRENIWLKGIGPEYLELAFKWAHDADPDVPLFYNDYGNEVENDKSNAIYNMFKKLREKGVPITGIGFQMHTSIEHTLDYKAIEKNINRFNKLGLEVQITELDVKIPEAQKSKEESYFKQAEIYSKMLKMCLGINGCTAFTIWGVTDKYTWLEKDNTNYKPLLFDENYRKKPSYKAIFNELKDLK